MIIWKLILNKNKSQKHIKRHWTLTLKISTKLKISTNIIKHLGVQSTKLYNNSSLKKLIFSQQIFKQYNNNANEPHNIPNDVKNNSKRMATEQGLYEKVVVICRKDPNITEENKNKNEDKFKSQGQSARS